MLTNSNCIRWGEHLRMWVTPKKKRQGLKRNGGHLFFVFLQEDINVMASFFPPLKKKKEESICAHKMLSQVFQGFSRKRGITVIAPQSSTVISPKLITDETFNLGFTLPLHTLLFWNLTGACPPANSEWQCDLSKLCVTVYVKNIFQLHL